jgi:hypothetical protein
MVWAPGQSGNPSGWQGGRQRRHREIFDEIKKLGHRDALMTLSTIQNDDKNDPSLIIAAAAALAPFAHPKLQSIPTPRFVDNPIEVPEFTHVSDAEAFLVKIAVLVARGELDFQSGLELSSLVKTWIDSQNARTELELKAMNQGVGETEQVIRIEGGLPALPGTNVTMPVLDGHATNGHALAAPTDAAPAIESVAAEAVPSQPSNDSTSGQGSP